MLNNQELPVVDQVVVTIRENQKNRINGLNLKRNRLLDTVTPIEQKLQRMSWELFNFLGIYKKSFWAKVLPMIVFVLVATAEMPLNATAFEIFLRSQTETLIIAILFGAVIALTAHLSGFFLKRYVVTRKTSNLIAGMLIIILTIIGLYVSSELRVQYLSTMNSVSMTSQGIQFFMSFFIFSAGVVASYHFTTSVDNIEKEKAYFQSLRELKKINRQISRVEKDIDDVNKKAENSIKKRITVMTTEEKEKTQEETFVAPVRNEELEKSLEEIARKNDLRKVAIEETDDEEEKEVELGKAN